MDKKDIKTLQLLEEIDKNKSINQRTIATNLNISLGLTNSFIKRLTKKGYIKISTIPKNRIKYLLTPNGIVEKTRLTYDYIKLSFSFYRDTRNKLSLIFKELEDQGIKKVAFYYANEIAEIAYISLQETNIEFINNWYKTKLRRVGYN